MSHQRSFADIGFRKQKLTKRQKFLNEMDQVVPWSQLAAIIEPHYPKAGKGTQPKPLELMLRIHFLQQWFNLSDPGMEDEIYDSASIRRFLSIDPLTDTVPDESTILRFRHLLEKHQLAGKLFESVSGDLVDKGLLLRGGTIVDATLIAAPSSTKNKAKKRDDGEAVAVKVQRPNIEVMVKGDLGIMADVVNTIEKRSRRIRDLGLSGMLDELAATSLKSLISETKPLTRRC